MLCSCATHVRYPYTLVRVCARYTPRARVCARNKRARVGARYKHARIFKFAANVTMLHAIYDKKDTRPDKSEMASSEQATLLQTAVFFDHLCAAVCGTPQSYV